MSTQSVLFDAPGPRTRRRMMWLNIVFGLVVAGLAALVLAQLGKKGQLAADLWTPFLQAGSWENFLIPGLINTLRAAGLAIIGSAVFGLVFGLGRLARSRVIRSVSGVVVEFFRAVPVLLMMIFIWLGLAQVDLMEPSEYPLVAVVAALILYNGSVFAELVRSGVYGLPRGQREAALAVGLTRGQSLRSVEVPQALIAMLPALVSQLVVILKDTALGYIITYRELLQEARQLGAANGNILQALAVAAVIFIVINYALTKLAPWLGQRLGRRTSGRTKVEAPSLIAATTGAPPT
ncbi:amino acid ABC transporter permease [Cellulomonas sp. P22]|uniref:amino acid ABC transporter permease n=1 Tax=Cellulomonas sp. P22 TaxID=3373189 RepID=UPI0037ABEBA6